jgi:hypothetical protein
MESNAGRRIAHERFVRILVWAVLSISLAAYILFGTVTVQLTRFFSVERSVRSVWRSFRADLPEVGNELLLAVLFWAAIVVFCIGVFWLLWISLTPDSGVSEFLQEPRADVLRAGSEPDQ